MTTRTHTETLAPGSAFGLTVDAQADGSQLLTLTVAEPEPVEPPLPPRQPLLVGIEGPSGQETTRILTGFPGVEAMREFGVKRAGETLPSLPGWTASKLAVMPATCRPHVSWKWWDAARQKAWLDSRPMSPGPGYWPELDTTYFHEPHGDIDPATYRTRAASWATMLRDHPNGGGIQNGPIVTRYWLMNSASGLPAADWCYDGMTFYGVDVYEPEAKAGQPTTPMSPADLWDPVLEKVYAVWDGDILVPEMGRRYGAGQARADALAADYAHLWDNHPRVRVVSYFNSSAFPEFAFAGPQAATVTDGGASTPEGRVWKLAMP